MKFNGLNGKRAATGQNEGKLMTSCLTLTKSTNAKTKDLFGWWFAGGVTNNLKILVPKCGSFQFRTGFVDLSARALLHNHVFINLRNGFETEKKYLKIVDSSNSDCSRAGNSWDGWWWTTIFLDLFFRFDVTNLNGSCSFVWLVEFSVI